MNIIKIIDFYSINNFHEIVNFCLLKCFCKIFSTVEYKIGKSAYYNIKKQIEKENITISNLKLEKKWVVEKDTLLGAFLRIIFGLFIVLKEYTFLRKNEYLYINYNNPFALPIILFLNKFHNKKVLIIFHGELELLLTKVPKRKLSFLYTTLNRFSFKHLLNKSNIKIIVLGNSIKNNLSSLFPKIKDNIISINHPYVFKEKQNSNIRFNNPLTIGTVGVLNQQKGLYELIDISNHFSKEIKAGNLKIKVIGKTENIFNKSDYKNITWSPDGFIPRDIFDKEIDTLDFILYLYPKDSYKLTASGAIFDAFSREKPIIALENDYFKATIENMKVGYMCNSIAEIESTIEYLLSKDYLQIKESFTNDIKDIKRHFEIDYVTNQLKLAIIDL